jgi:hypothetical protein
MDQVNLGRVAPLHSRLNASLRSLVASSGNGNGTGIGLIQEDDKYLKHVLDLPVDWELYQDIRSTSRRIGVSPNFKEIIDTFSPPEGETPPGFRLEFNLEADGVLRVDMARDITRDRNGQKRPTNYLFSADSANPYEVAEIKNLLANLTCNPGIIYDLFINNPKANVGNKFKDRDEVMKALGDVLGPGCDISVEVNNPFDDIEKIIEEAEHFREMLSPYRVVIKIPHTGPVNAENVDQLLSGDKRFGGRYDQGPTKDMLRGHNLAMALRERGFRINFTLMFEPYQTALALQAKPYFINSFVRHRLSQTETMKRYLDLFELTEEASHLEDLRSFLIEKDYLSPAESGMNLLETKQTAARIIAYRGADGPTRIDGLDGVRHNLRMLKQTNLPETKLIVCSMEGEFNYPDIDRLLTEPEFADMMDRLVITAEPEYLARFTSANQVVSYQRRFMNAARDANASANTLSTGAVK